MTDESAETSSDDPAKLDLESLRDGCEALGMIVEDTDFYSFSALDLVNVIRVELDGTFSINGHFSPEQVMELMPHIKLEVQE